ncbi:MAG: hypothetical protein REI94_08735 [Moraxellaceae bacterium]|nr:hypothetical protein [Moraxellaceae bacterium]
MKNRHPLPGPRIPSVPPSTAPALESEARALAERLLGDVALTRGTADKQQQLTALSRAALFFPVFADWPAPVETWLDAAITLAGAMAENEALEILSVRRGACAMRRLDLDAALAQLDGLAPTTTRARVYALATRCRVLTRQQRFADASAALAAASDVSLEHDDWLNAHLALAGAELALEAQEQTPTAIATRLSSALKRLQPQQLEDRIQALQSLGFSAIERKAPLEAWRHLDEARGILRGVGAWPEVVQMHMACASMLTIMGQPQQADQMLQEAVTIDTRQLGGRWSALCQLSLARGDMARGDLQASLGQALKSASGFARQGNGLGFAAALIFVARAHEAGGDKTEAYRVLSLGTGIARALKAPRMEQFITSQIDDLRNRLGPQQFERLAAELLAQAQARAQAPH